LFDAVLGIFACSSLLLLPTLLPLAATDNNIKNTKNATDTTSKGTFSQLDNLSMANITVSKHNNNSILPIDSFSVFDSLKQNVYPFI